MSALTALRAFYADDDVVAVRLLWTASITPGRPAMHTLDPRLYDSLKSTLRLAEASFFVMRAVGSGKYHHFCGEKRWGVAHSFGGVNGFVNILPKPPE